MGVYSTGGNASFGGYEELNIHEGYEGTYGVQTALIESVKNDLALFEGVICCDIQEQVMMTSLNEGAIGEEEVQAFTEATGAGLVDKIKAFLKKAWEKIKSIIHSFIVMITNVVTRDNKEFVNKYRTAVLKKDLTKLKFKWANAKDGKDTVIPNAILSQIETLENAGKSISAISTTNYTTLKNKYAKDESEYRKDMDKLKSDTTKEKLYQDVFGLKSTPDVSKIAKEVEETFFEDTDEREGLDSGLLNDIMNILCESSKILKSFKTAETKTTKVYNDRLKEIESARNDVAKAKDGAGTIDRKVDNVERNGFKAGYNKDTQQAAIKALNTLYTEFSLEQEAVTKLYSVYGALYKGRVKLCRATFARAAAFNDKSVKEDAILFEAMDDVQHSIVEEQFEGIYA